MNNLVFCPYCGTELCISKDNDGWHLEDIRHEQACTVYKKNFVFITYRSYTHTAYSADCLNGAEHNLKLFKSYPKEFSAMICKDCDYERNATHEEFEETK